eukprot:TRINITY_DN2543_c1_g2_i3.p1 TRINITY_DN2543_c1_g2~~TRINITY_DN2543_c1_g2_i3.p1  ORF type:complete len:564 (-),score=145.52 TRINITY_DN2543_c1_g2_i3:122-1813(-)
MSNKKFHQLQNINTFYMLVLYPTPAGYSLIRLKDDSILEDPDTVQEHFASGQKAKKMVELIDFKAFQTTAEAVLGASALQQNSIDKDLKKFLKRNLVKKDIKELIVDDHKLGAHIKKSLDLNIIYNAGVMELFRGIRSQIHEILEDVNEKDYGNMRLGLAHSLSRFSLKFSPDKIDSSIIQAVKIHEELVKETNTYFMRFRDFYTIHFPELAPLVTDALTYVQVVLRMGYSKNAITTDFSGLVSDEIAEEIRKASLTTIGSMIADEDLAILKKVGVEIERQFETKGRMAEYIKNRITAIAPSVSVVAGEQIAAKLVSKAGSLISLAKMPASTIQIVGAEKALFRALKTKHKTPKYGYLYHASIVSNASTKNKGKMSRAAACQVALAARYDAFGEETNSLVGIKAQERLQNRLEELEGSAIRKSVGRLRTSANYKDASKDSYDMPKKSSHKQDVDIDYEVGYGSGKRAPVIEEEKNEPSPLIDETAESKSMEIGDEEEVKKEKKEKKHKDKKEKKDKSEKKEKKDKSEKKEKKDKSEKKEKKDKSEKKEKKDKKDKKDKKKKSD